MEKFIHQIWYQGQNELPQKYQSSSETWRLLNEGYEYKFWDAKKLHHLVHSKYPTFSARWNAIQSTIKRCDAARCFILHAFGGVYADFDTVCVRPMDDFISINDLQDAGVILSHESRATLAWKSAVAARLRLLEPNLPIVGNAIMLSRKAEPFWLDFLTASFERADRVVLESFSTWHLSKFIRKYDFPEVKVVADHYLMSPQYLPGQSFALHSYDATWFDHNLAEPWCFA